MIQFRLAREVEKVAARYRTASCWMVLAGAWFLAAVGGLALWSVQASLGWSSRSMLGATGILAAALTALAVAWAWKRPISPVWIARQIERKYPELSTCLLAAIEQRPDLPNGRFGFLQSAVIRQALAHADRNPWVDVVPPRWMMWGMAAGAAGMASLVMVLAGATFWRPAGTIAGSDPPPAGWTASAEFSVTIEPGNAEIERGTSLLVLARLTGAMPPDATLVAESEGEEPVRLPMAASLKDPVFGGRIPSVDAPLAYHVELGGKKTETYHVAVFDYPRLERADARLVYPGFTSQEERLIQDVRSVSAVEGTKLTLICRLNKPVASATLVEEGHPPIPLAAVPGEEAVVQTEILCDRSRRLELKLIDEAGRSNVKPATFSIRVLPNQPPVVRPQFPARDVEVSALEEMDLKATAWDDFGLGRHGLTYTLAGSEPVELVLGESGEARSRKELASTVRLEELSAQPDELVSYHFWAEDFDSRGQVRRTESDMYFAEVRPFEEVFRQGEQPPGGESQPQSPMQGQQGGANAQQARQLAQLQKDIMNATWKLIRRETGETASDAFQNDAREVANSQSTALEQASSLTEELVDAQSQEHAADAIKSMEEALRELTQAADEKAAEGLRRALAAEQKAYQSLLKLRAREHEVVRSNQQQQQGASSPSAARSEQQQQQLQQLDLENQENRYETERTAQSQPTSDEDRENRQVLNRLQELARRQQDLNERLKELQTALEEAQTEEQRDEVRRQLERLQEEERQILEDTDELRSRMESPENQERMAESREQLDPTREQVRNAAEALEQGQVSQAAAAGTRAEQQFEDLRDEFRRQASSRFNEQVRDLQEAARQLDEREQEISSQLQTEAQPSAPTPSLREESQRDEIAQGLGEQRQRLADLEQRMRETIEEAEPTEPILSDRLYETVRNLHNREPGRALEAAEGSLSQGFLEDAIEQEQVAGQGIRELREGIDNAAEAVLGDDTEALRRARDELNQLSRELGDEINRNAPDSSPDSEGQPGEHGQPGEERPQNENAGQPGQEPGQQPQGQGQRQPGSQPGPDQQSGRPQDPAADREGQPGEGQAGENQPGQGQPGPGQPGQPQQGGGQPGQTPDPQNPDDPRQPGRRGAPGQPPSLDDRPTGPGGPRLTNEVGPGFGPFEDSTAPRFAPITGEDFLDWSDRLRDVEELVPDPRLRAEAQAIRERARAIRAEHKRHSAPPNWDVLKNRVFEPLAELEKRVEEELLRRTSKDALVPLDRDPVPPKYSEKTRKYFERLGSGQ